jgi:hypothetical protein
MLFEQKFKSWIENGVSKKIIFRKYEIWNINQKADDKNEINTKKEKINI